MAQTTNQTTDGFNSIGAFSVLTFSGHQRTIHYNASNNLPIIFLASDFSTPLSLPNHCSFLSSTDSREAGSQSIEPIINENLSTAQCKLLKLHYKLGHTNMHQIQYFAKEGLLGSSAKALGNCDLPLCRACIHGKQHRKSAGSTPLDIDHLNPGDCVSGDQVESSSPGLVPTYRGTPTTARYHAGTLLVDHASRYLFFTPHISTGSKEAIQAKHKFELLASQFNRSIKCYHTDNGIFSSKDFRTHCTNQHQRIKYCGVNVHHQHGIAERHIRTITERARTMLIHAMIHWPEIIMETLWPYALRLAVDIHNSTPNQSGMTPEEIFTGSKFGNKLQDFHSFGCPIFVLDPTLQQGQKIPRWKPRSRVGVYLGFSPEHASSVPIVLSTTTGLVSPQFHVIYDDYFTTTNCLQTNVLPSNWSSLLESSSSKYVDDDFDPSLFLDTTMFNDQSNGMPSITSSQRELQSNAHPLQREENSESTTALQKEPSTIPPQGWNSNHQYQTRFKQKFHANHCISEELSTNPFDDNLYEAFIAVQNSQPMPSDNELNFLEHYACAASTNPEIQTARTSKTT